MTALVMTPLHGSLPPPIDPNSHLFVTAPRELQLLIAGHLRLKDALALPQISKACSPLGALLRSFFGGVKPDDNNPEEQIANCINVAQMEHTFALLTPMILILKQEQVLPKNAGTDWKELSLLEIKTALLWLKSKENRRERAPVYQMCRALYFSKKELILGCIPMCFQDDPLFLKVYKALEHMKVWEMVSTNRSTKHKSRQHNNLENSFENPLEKAMVSILLRHNGWRQRFDLLSPAIQNDPLMRILLIARNSLKPSQITQEEKSEPATSLIFLQHNPSSIKSFSQYEEDAFVAQTLITKEPTSLKSFSETIRSNRTLATYAAQHSPHGLKGASKSLRQDRDFVLEAIQHHPEAYAYAAKELITNTDDRINQDFMVAAVAANNELASRVICWDQQSVTKDFLTRLLNVIQDPFRKLELFSTVFANLQLDSEILTSLDFGPSD